MLLILILSLVVTGEFCNTSHHLPFRSAHVNVLLSLFGVRQIANAASHALCSCDKKLLEKLNRTFCCLRIAFSPVGLLPLAMLNIRLVIVEKGARGVRHFGSFMYLDTRKWDNGRCHIVPICSQGFFSLDPRNITTKCFVMRMQK